MRKVAATDATLVATCCNGSSAVRETTPRAGFECNQRGLRQSWIQAGVSAVR